MGADFSRIRSDPLLDFAGVELKQGGVVLDADFNELGAVIDRRLRALASDVLGRSRVSSTTPLGFRVTVQGGMLRIDPGRLYVDGLLAENHGAPSDDASDRLFDPLLAEPAFADPLTYDAQPYLPSPPALPTGGRHLVYLDVWNRQVTHLERPALVEPAVGVESSSRVQTVWQVRVHPRVGNATCATPDDDIARWSALTAPSTGRLTTGTFEVPPADDPCELPPSGGYRGLENQTYRIEIHDPGDAGAGATFKWSRENASVGSRVASVVSATELELHSLGRDDVLRFNSDDWVEIVDDQREFSQRSGEMRRITVNESARRITFAPALPAEMLPAAFPDAEFPSERNLRVIRWDQNHDVLSVAADGTTPVFQDLDAGTSGVINVPPAGTTLLLEHGVTVRFSAAAPVATGAPTFRAGDHWVVAARTADASIEELDAAPPRGIHHHYERLGIWDVAAGEVSDCRHGWPPPGGGEDCSCTVCVSPDSHADGSLTIQGAIDRIRDSGGTVCLAVGQYALRAPLQLNGVRAITIRGHGAATVLVAPEGAAHVGGSVAVTIEDLALLSLARRSAIVVRSVMGLTLQRLLIAVVGNPDTQGAAIALTGVAAGLVIRDNVIFGPIGIRGGEAAAGNDDPPPLAFLMTALMRIEDNLLWCERQAVALAGPVLHLLGNRIVGNEVVGGRQGGITVLGLAAAGASMKICDNSLNVSGAGITAGVDGLWVEGNKVASLTDAATRVAGSSGITLTSGLDPNGSDQCQVLANQVSGFDAAGIRIAAPVKQMIVKLNIVSGCGNGIVAEDDARAGHLSIENNQVSDIGQRGAPANAEVVGIGLVRADSASVVGNRVQRIGVLATNAALRAGIAATAVQRLHIGGNDITDVAPPGNFEAGLGAGVLVRPPYGHLAIADNQVDRDSKGSAQPGGRFVALRVDDAAAQTPNSRVGSYAALRVNPTTTLVLGARRAFVVSAAVSEAAASLPTANVSVRGNKLSASGRLPAVLIDAAGDCQFSENRCELRSGSDAAVRLICGTTIVNANRVLGGEVSIDIRGDPKRVTVLGNITDRAINLGNGLPPPWEALNIRV